MKKIHFFILSMTIGIGTIKGQDYSLYSNEVLTIESEYLKETIDLNIHIPETQPFSAQTTKYPITIIFDSQHSRTYPIIINSIDLLTSETQMPESIIIGVPFNFQNRLYFTSSQKKIKILFQVLNEWNFSYLMNSSLNYKMIIKEMTLSL